MADMPEAAGDAPQAPQTEAPTSTNTEPAQAPAPAPSLHGFTEAQLEEMSKFYSANGGYEKAFGRVKSAISNPQPAPAPQPEAQPTDEPTSQQLTPTQMSETKYKAPEGARTSEDLMAEFYFRTLSEKPEYAAISEDIRRGNVLSEMNKLGIDYRYPDGSWNDGRINEYLKLKAQTVPAKGTSTEPDASTAPTVDYVEVGDKIENIDQAYKVLMQPGHPKREDAKAFIKENLNKK